MLFKYKITLDVEVEFEAPLLGTDTTGRRRKQTDAIAKATLAELTKLGTTSYIVIDREINEENLKGRTKGDITMMTAATFKQIKNK
jgi:hypothetical protein